MYAAQTSATWGAAPCSQRHGSFVPVVLDKFTSLSVIPPNTGGLIRLSDSCDALTGNWLPRPAINIIQLLGDLASAWREGLNAKTEGLRLNLLGVGEGYAGEDEDSSQNTKKNEWIIVPRKGHTGTYVGSYLHSVL